jgi:hypothetical protein
MDSVAAAEATRAELGVAPEPHAHVNEPLNIEDAPRVRTKLHLYTTLIALYASNAISVVECRF